MIELNGGTNFELNGLQVVGGSLRRSLGLSHDVSTLICELPEAGFPQLKVPKPGEEFAIVAQGQSAGVAPLLNTEANGRAPSGALLAPIADVRVAEAAGGSQWEFILDGFLVDSVTMTSPGSADPEPLDGSEPSYSRATNGIKFITVTLVDHRRLWPDHSRALPQHEFNVKSGAQGLLPRTLLEVDGEFVEATLTQIVEYVCRFLTGNRTAPGPVPEASQSRGLSDRGVEVVHTPDRWDEIKPTFQFNPGENPYIALGQILREFPARVALHWDNTVGFYEAGQGVIGYDPVAGWRNDTPLPADEELESLQVEQGLGWVPGYFIAYGPPTIASVAVDCLEPIIFIDRSLSLAEVFPQLDIPADSPEINRQANLQAVNLYKGFKELLQRDKITSTQQEIRRLERALGAKKPTGFANPETVLFNLKKKLRDLQTDAGEELTLQERRFLDRFVMRPPSNGDSRLISRETAAIIRRDAYKYWRLPGAETYNRHLLPIEDRAEVSPEGTRLPPLIQSYRWAARSVPVGGNDQRVTTIGDIATRAEQEGHRAYYNMGLISTAILGAIKGTLTRTVVNKLKFRTQVDGNLSAADAYDSFFAGSRRPRTELQDVVGKAVEGNNSRLGAAVKGVIQRIQGDPAAALAIKRAGFDPATLLKGLIRDGTKLVNVEWQGDAAGFTAAAAAYRQQLDVFLANQQQSFRPANRSQVFTADLAVQIVRLLLPVGNLIKTGQISRKDLAAGRFAAAARVVQLVSRAAQRYEDFDRAVRNNEPTTADDAGTREQRYVIARHLVNLPRLDDGNFSLYSRELGIWYTPIPCGHADRLDVPSPDGAALVPRAVRAVFGTKMRPVARTDTETVNTTLQSTPEGLSTRETVWDTYAKQLIASGESDFPGATASRGRPPWCVLDAPKDIFPRQVLDLEDTERAHLGNYHQAFERPPLPESGSIGTRIPAPKSLRDLPADQGAPVYDDDFRLLIQLPDKSGEVGNTNETTVRGKAQDKCGEKFFEQEPYRKGWVRRALRPLRVNPNGRISGVEIVLQDDLAGFATIISTGLPDRPFLGTGDRTYVRNVPNRVRRERAKPPEERG